MRTYLSATRCAQLVRTNELLSKSTMLMPSFRWPCSTCASTLGPSSNRTCSHLPFSSCSAQRCSSAQSSSLRENYEHGSFIDIRTGAPPRTFTLHFLPAHMCCNLHFYPPCLLPANYTFIPTYPFGTPYAFVSPHTFPHPTYLPHLALINRVIE